MQPLLSNAPSTPNRPSDCDLVLQALALGAGVRPRTWILNLLTALGERQRQGPRWTGSQLAAAVSELAREGRVTEEPLQRGAWTLAPGLLAPNLAAALERYPVERAAEALAQGDGYGHEPAPGGRWHFHTEHDAVAQLRLRACSGAPLAELMRYEPHCNWGVQWDGVLEHALLEDLDEALFARLHPSVQAAALGEGLQRCMARWQPAGDLPVAALAERFFAAAPQDRARADLLDTGSLRWDWAAWLLLAGRADEVEPVIYPLTQPGPTRSAGEAADWDQLANAMEAVRLCRLGQWRESVELFEAVLAERRAVSGQRKGLLPLMIATPYVLALMALGDPAGLRSALKFCLTESGKRQAVADNPWGVMALALEMRLGESRRDLQRFAPQSRAPYVDQADYWRWLMRAWLSDASAPASASAPRGAQRVPAAWQALHTRCVAAGLLDLAAQLDGALAVIEGRPAPEHFFAGQREEAWRSTLAALAAVAAPEATRAASGAAATVQATRLVWVLDVNDFGAIRSLLPREQKQGSRGWGKPRDFSLAKLAKAETLPAWDAALARCIRQNSAERTLRLDLAAAAVALIGHPCVEFADQPEVPVTLTEASPQIEVADQGEQLLVRLQPAPRWTDAAAQAAEPHHWTTSVAEQKEQEALLDLTILRDAPQHARLVRLNPAQRRAAQLIGAGLSLPKAAMDQLEPVLRSLGAHFQVHADELQAAREVSADSRLRAELSPVGDGVHLRLVVAPLGVGGPRVNPGSGRTRLIARVDGETVGAQRDLAAELGHLETVLDACPMLATLPAGAPAAWDLETPDTTLALLERLHSLNAVTALDWPQGRAIRVDSAGIGQLSVNVQSGSEWLALQGGITLNEQLVASLARLLDWSATQKSRFIPLGEGRYLALTEELKSRLEELASVAELDRQDQARVTPLAAAWLERTLAGADVAADAGFLARIERLAEAQQFDFRLPSTLQARLRPYQEEGYVWAMRLAEVGLGACLADDMGLGKTLQALAVLLARAAGGPALVVAPTSLIGNWQAEARRFAPSLRVMPYAEGDAAGDRDALISAAGAQDVLLVTYPLLQLNAEAFAQRRWHSLVLDEAQAIKNAAAKRSQAAFELGADFRLALSGTPIENRLAELWSIMRVCNPGLLGTLARFNLRFAVPIERDRHRGAQRTLRRLIGPFILRRSKAQVLDDLPPRTELTLLVQGDATERAHYEALRRQALRDAEQALASGQPGQAHLNILAQLTRLRRAACDPRLVTPDLLPVGAKVQAFGELAAELVANGHKALVFSQFVDFLALLKVPLDAAGIRYQYLDGSTPTAERTRRVAAFQAGEGDLFLISLKAGGFGLNLTVADYVVIADPWWNPAAEDQASGRAHRIGQQRPVTVYRLVHQGTLEEKIVALHSDKRELADSVLEGHDSAAPLPAEALLELLQDAAQT